MLRKLNGIFFGAFLLILLCNNCFGGAGFATPEETLNTYKESIRDLDYPRFYSCFVISKDAFSEEELSFLAKTLFKENVSRKFKVVDKNTVSPEVVELTVEELVVFLDHGNQKMKSKVLLSFHIDGGNWKIFKTTALESIKVE